MKIEQKKQDLEYYSFNLPNWNSLPYTGSIHQVIFPMKKLCSHINF